jgi:hypothetical protein
MKRSSSCQTSVLNFFKSPSGTRVSPPVLLVTVNDDPDDVLQFGSTSSFSVIYLIFFVIFF